jgi:hypothetical protein
VKRALAIVASSLLCTSCLAEHWLVEDSGRIDAIIARGSDPADGAAHDGIPIPHEVRHKAPDDDSPPIGTSCIPDDTVAKRSSSSSSSKKSSKSSKSSSGSGSVSTGLAGKVPKTPKVTVQ